MSKKSTAILIIIILAILGYTGWVWYEKNQALTPEVIENNEEQNGGIDTSDWASFNATDLGVKNRIIMKLPSNWINKGSVDGGSISSVPFYLQDRYKENCNTMDGGGVECKKEGMVALLNINTDVPVLVENQSQSLKIDRYDAYVDNKNVQTGIKNVEYIGNDQKRVIIPNVNNVTFEFIMVVSGERDEKVFNEILKTIRF